MKYKDYSLPKKLFYNKDSSWILVEDDILTLGIIEPIAKTLDEFVFIKLPDLKEIKEGETYVSLETLKWSGHFSSPVNGEIIEVNNDLYDSPEEINDNAYGSWIVKIKIKDLKETKKLFKAEDILEWLDKIIEGGNI